MRFHNDKIKGDPRILPPQYTLLGFISLAAHEFDQLCRVVRACANDDARPAPFATATRREPVQREPPPRQPSLRRATAPGSARAAQCGAHDPRGAARTAAHHPRAHAERDGQNGILLDEQTFRTRVSATGGRRTRACILSETGARPSRDDTSSHTHPFSRTNRRAHKTDRSAYSRCEKHVRVSCVCVSSVDHDGAGRVPPDTCARHLQQGEWWFLDSEVDGSVVLTLLWGSTAHGRVARLWLCRLPDDR